MVRFTSRFPLDLAPNTRHYIQPLEQPVAEQNAWDVLEPMTGTVEAERLD